MITTNDNLTQEALNKDKFIIAIIEPASRTIVERFSGYTRPLVGETIKTPQGNCYIIKQISTLHDKNSLSDNPPFIEMVCCVCELIHESNMFEIKK